MRGFVVVIGEYDDRAYFIVRGAGSTEEAYKQVRDHIEKNLTYSSWMLAELYRVEEIPTEEGVTPI